MASRLPLSVEMRNLRFFENWPYRTRRSPSSSDRFFDLAMPVLSFTRVAMRFFFIIDAACDARRRNAECVCLGAWTVSCGYNAG